jgi:tRNA (guanine10-N2)-dimethyltransferase
MVSRTEGITGFVKNPSFFFELSGEHPEMALQEALSCIKMAAGSVEGYVHGPGYLVAPLPAHLLPWIAQRIALTHRIGRFMGWLEREDGLEGIDASSLPEGSFSVRAKRYEKARPDIDSRRLTRTLGGHLSLGRQVDLEDPDIEVRAFISDRIGIHHSLFHIDRHSLEERKVAERPFFSPISLHPRYARALINMVEVGDGQTLLDPFCGTGGILLEAASMGIRALASDIDPDMIEGTERNMRHFGLELSGQAVTDVAEIGSHFPNTDAIVTDPPYGRSASTRGENISALYVRALEAAKACLKPGGRMGIVVPIILEPTEGLHLEHLFHQKVHGSLSRHYHIFRRC